MVPGSIEVRRLTPRSLHRGSSSIANSLSSVARSTVAKTTRPGIDFFRQLKKAGNFIPDDGTPQTVASGQTPIVIDWDYLNLAYRKEFPAVHWQTVIPSDGVYGSFYCQAVNASAPHPNAARLWMEFLYSDQGQLLWLKGYSHPARFQDLAKRKKIPAALLKALPSSKLYARVKFASDA